MENIANIGITARREWMEDIDRRISYLNLPGSSDEHSNSLREVDGGSEWANAGGISPLLL